MTKTTTTTTRKCHTHLSDDTLGGRDQLVLLLPLEPLVVSATQSARDCVLARPARLFLFPERVSFARLELRDAERLTGRAAVRPAPHLG